jgi:hypothetical protein
LRELLKLERKHMYVVDLTIKELKTS